MARLQISVALQPGDDLRALTDQIQHAAGFHADGSGAGSGYRDTEYEVPDRAAGDEAARRVQRAFPDRVVAWSVSTDEGGWHHEDHR